MSDISYTLKVSRRSKYARLKMVPREGLVVVVPEGYDRKQIPVLLKRYEDWIRRAAGRLERQQPDEHPLLPGGLPSSVVFRSVGEEWRVEYDPALRKRVERNGDGGSSVLLPVEDARRDDARDHLLLWLRKRAAVILLPMLEERSRALGLRYASAGVRLQKSRWGSCSGRGRITLNTKLLFLPPELARYIMTHELCHTAEMNHSGSFWRLVQRHDPDFRQHDRAMRDAWKYVPGWVSGHYL
ncbi:M48 family metallopeptidase [Chlorobium phaeovibrioides]|uniref:M48 family metallopeptidase n=1 Tax=Chlorobium phaeovibrioides TaxID=1094 RepID=UPI0012306251|nr:SprT family zinc-dependent metalloprotease [Chlorobium phaeovibrioides]QEQ56799.1 M48 family metallopeptidase [Chlorobium phaeovibrioides]